VPVVPAVIVPCGIGRGPDSSDAEGGRAPLSAHPPRSVVHNGPSRGIHLGTDHHDHSVRQRPRISGSGNTAAHPAGVSMMYSRYTPRSPSRKPRWPGRSRGRPGRTVVPAGSRLWPLGNTWMASDGLAFAHEHVRTAPRPLAPKRVCRLRSPQVGVDEQDLALRGGQGSRQGSPTSRSCLPRAPWTSRR